MQSTQTTSSDDDKRILTISDPKKYQLSFVRPAQMALFSEYVCSPPLGQATVVPYGEDSVELCVCIESSAQFPVQPWEAVIWHNGHHSREWSGLKLQRSEQADKSLAVESAERPRAYRNYFLGRIDRPRSIESNVVNFTLKYKTESSDNWKWVNDGTCLTDGTIIFQINDLPTAIPGYFSDFPAQIKPKVLRTEVPGTKLWQLDFPTPGATDQSGYSHTTLGAPKDLVRWTSLIRIWAPWIAPRHGKDFFHITEAGLTVSFLRSDGLHLVLIAVSGINNVLTEFSGDTSDGKGKLVVNSRNDNIKEAHGTVLAAVGYTQDEALAACMYGARKLVEDANEKSGISKQMAEVSNAAEKSSQTTLPKGDVTTQWFQDWQDGFTFCTWNALGQSITEKSLLDALEDLAKHKINISNLIIDDGWQSLDNEGQSQFLRGWTSFEADKKKFPSGLKGLTKIIREKYPAIKNIGVWHAILGYWGAVSPESEIARKYSVEKVRKSPLTHSTGMSLDGGEFYIVPKDKAKEMYDDFYSFLTQSGVNAVKTDAQFFLDVLRDPADRRDLIPAYLSAWDITTLRYMGDRAISCMSLFPQAMFASQLPITRPRLTIRNSDDFFPEIPASHPWHIFNNAFAALFTCHLNALPDWDMFQTSHEYSSFHAAARAISGGPIYTTDYVGEHDLDLINQMTARTTQGETIILRPSTIAKVVERDVYTAYEEQRLLRIGGYHGMAETGTGLVGAFNTSPAALPDFVDLKDFPGVDVKDKSRKYIVRAFTTGQISRPISIDDPASRTSLYLQFKGWEILTAHPLTRLNGSGKAEICIAPLGLLGKITGVASILSHTIRSDEREKLRMDITLKALGTFGVFVGQSEEDEAGNKISKNDFLVLLQGQVVPLSSVEFKDSILHVDLAEAWKELGLKPSFSNDVNVIVTMS